MTRGMKGCYIYCTDKNLQNYFIDNLRKQFLAQKSIEKHQKASKSIKKRKIKHKKTKKRKIKHKKTSDIN